MQASGTTSLSLQSLWVLAQHFTPNRYFSLAPH